MSPEKKTGLSRLSTGTLIFLVALYVIAGSLWTCNAGRAQSLCTNQITYRSKTPTAPYSQLATGTCPDGSTGCLTASEVDDNFQDIEDLLCKGGLKVEDLSTACTVDQLVKSDGSGGLVCTDPSSGSPLTVRDESNTVNVPNVTEMRFTDGTVVDDGGGVVSIASGGGGSGFGEYDPDEHPSSCAICDEFSTSFEQTWTAFNGSDTTFAQAAGTAILTYIGSAGNNISGDALPALPTGVDWDFYVKATGYVPGTDKGTGSGVIVAGTVAAPTSLHTMSIAASNVVRYRTSASYTWTAFSLAASASLPSFTGTGISAPPIYYRWHYVTATKVLTGYWSYDGATWIQLYSSTVSQDPVYAFVFAGTGASPGVFPLETVFWARVRTDVNGLAGQAGGPAVIGGGSGSSVALDLSNDGSNESSGITKIETTEATPSIFTMPSADVFKIDTAQPWPTASALAADPAACTSGQYVYDQTAAGVLTCKQVEASEVAVADTGGYFTGTDVEAALQEIGPTMTDARAPTAHAASHELGGSDELALDGSQITGGTVPAARLGLMTGDSGSGGASGSVPAPSTGDAAAGKYLKASGAWAVPPDNDTAYGWTLSGSTTTVATTIGTLTGGDCVELDAYGNFVDAGAACGTGGGGTPGGSSGQIQWNNAGSFDGAAGSSVDASGQVGLTSQAITDTPLTIAGASGQTADVMNMTDSVGTSRFSVDKDGGLWIASDGGASRGSYGTRGALSITPTGGGDDPVISTAGSSYSLMLKNGDAALVLENNLHGVQIYSDGNANSRIELTTRTNPSIRFKTYGADAYIYGPSRETIDDYVYPLHILGGQADPTATTNLVGGDIYLVGGPGASSSAGVATGGQTYIDGGPGYGTGSNGDVHLGENNASQVIVGPSSLLQLTPTASPPKTCSSATEGSLYSDTSHALCYCDGSTWTVVSGAGTCS